MSRDRLDGWSEGIPYRMTYGIAHRWQERRSIYTMKDDPTPAEVAALVEQARREVGEPFDEELIREAIDDALNGRRPRW